MQGVLPEVGLSLYRPMHQLAFMFAKQNRITTATVAANWPLGTAARWPVAAQTCLLASLRKSSSLQWSSNGRALGSVDLEIQATSTTATVACGGGEARADSAEKRNERFQSAIFDHMALATQDADILWRIIRWISVYVMSVCALRSAFLAWSKREQSSSPGAAPLFNLIWFLRKHLYILARCIDPCES